MKKPAITEKCTTIFPIIRKMYRYDEANIHQITFSNHIGHEIIGDTCLIVISVLPAIDIASIINNHLHTNFNGKIIIKTLEKDDTEYGTYPQLHLGKFIQYLESIRSYTEDFDNANNIGNIIIK